VCLDPALASVSPQAILVPAKSENFLRQVLKWGFPEPAEYSIDPGPQKMKTKGGGKSKQNQQSEAMSIVLSLQDPTIFTKEIRGKRLAILTLYLPSRADEITQFERYLSSQGELRVSCQDQLLPMVLVAI